jgi:hypothetical protein
MTRQPTAFMRDVFIYRSSIAISDVIERNGFCRAINPHPAAMIEIACTDRIGI